jgi:adenine-specific DNA-methyltransferase
MIPTEPEKLSLETPNPVLARLEVLREHLPEIFSDGKIDLERLKTLLGDDLESNRERFGLSWAGKAEAVRAVQISSTGALRPKRDESVDFDSTGNAIIEGDNLEVLKLLQRSYHNKIKMIYIDPPYNTGNDFVYPDNFRDGLRQYQLFSGQVSDDGSKLTTNGDHAGRIHSRWLSMMYPRLQLAKSLLKDDGVIFISIDDHEVHNLRALMDEIFGEENLIGVLMWHRRQQADNRNENNFSNDHEYVVCYAKSPNASLVGKSIDKSKYSNPDNDPRGDWASIDLSGLATKEQRPNLHYDIMNPKTDLVYPPNPNRGWSKSRERIELMISEGRILFPAKPEGRPREKKFLSDIQREQTGFSSVLDSDLVGFTTNGTREISELFNEKIFDFPKPKALLRQLVAQVSNKDDTVLDFFAGSGTLGHAVLEQNMLDGGNRKFILVQLPETTPNTTFPTISSVTRERVKRAAAKIRESMNGSLNLESPPDLGFRAFTLDSSNFKIWDNENPDLEGQLLALVQNVLDGRSEEDILFELLLKSGLPLSSGITTLTVAEKRVYSVSEGTLLICLERPITSDTLRGMIALKPAQVLCLDVAFEGDDALKTNMVLEMRDHEILFRTV